MSTTNPKSWFKDWFNKTLDQFFTSDEVSAYLSGGGETVLFHSYADVTNVDDVVASDDIPANSLSADGKIITARYAMSFLDAESFTVSLSIGGVSVFSLPVVVGNEEGLGQAILEVKFTRSGATTLISVADLSFSLTAADAIKKSVQIGDQSDIDFSEALTLELSIASGLNYGVLKTKLITLS